MRYLASRDPDALHPVEAELPAVEGEHAGLNAGLTEADADAEAARVADLPVVGGESPVYELADYDIEIDPATLNPKEVPRHDRFASENSGVVAERVVPHTPTNANPSYADGGPGIGVSSGEAEAVVVEEPVDAAMNPPAHSATKIEWVNYVVTNFEISAEDAEALTKAQLIETYGD